MTIRYAVGSLGRNSGYFKKQSRLRDLSVSLHGGGMFQRQRGRGWDFGIPEPERERDGPRSFQRSPTAHGVDIASCRSQCFHSPKMAFQNTQASSNSISIAMVNGSARECRDLYVPPQGCIWFDQSGPVTVSTLPSR